MYNGKHILIENGPGIGDVITLTPAVFSQPLIP